MINVTVSGTAVGVAVSSGIGPAGFISAPGTSTNAFGTFQLTAGNGITISTSVGQFQVASYNTSQVASYAPVQSVAGRVGNVVLQAADVTAGTFAIARIPTISYTALANVPTSFGPSVHTHSTADVVSFTAAAAAAAPVQLVAGRTGAISLTVADVSGLAPVASSGSYTSLQNVPATFAPSAHTHGTADITGITGAFAAASHTHDAAAISSGVLSVARIPTIGYTALGGVPTTFAPQAHTHSTADVVGLTASFSQVGHTHDYAASIHTHSTADIAGYTALPALAGKAGPLVTDGTVATWSTRYGVVDPVLVQGAGMTLTRDTAAGSITVAFAGGTSGVAVSSATPQPLGTASAGSSSDASRADHVHLMPSAADVGAAAAGHAHEYVQVLNGLTGTIAISGGAGVTVSTASSSITIAAAGSYTLPTASSSVLGGVKVGANLTITDGVLAATGGSGLTWSSVPASATATGTAGSIAYDHANGFFYVATAANSWKRAALSTWLPFAPTDIAGVQAWYDASDASTLYDATSGGSLVAADGAVARWEDKSGNARHATQGTSGNRPMRKTGVQGGLGVLRFDGSSDHLSIPSSTDTFSFLHTSNASVFVVFQVAGANPNNVQSVIDNCDATGQKGFNFGYDDRASRPVNNRVYFYAGIVGDYAYGVETEDNKFPSGSFKVVTGRIQAANATTSQRARIYVNGAIDASVNSLTGSPTGSAASNLHIGCSINSTTSATSAFLNGDIAEIIIYNAALSDTDRAAVESYLMTKWGIA